MLPQGEKRNLLIYSQCFIYGGSERLMKSIYDNDYIQKHFDITFSYCYFRDYKKGLALDKPNDVKALIVPVYLLDNGNFFYKIDLAIRIRFFRYLLKLPFYILGTIGVYAVWNYIYFLFFIKSQKPDVVHINNGGYPAAITCNQLAKVLYFFKKIKVIYQVNGKATDRKFLMDKYWDKWIQNVVRYFITHSNQNAVALSARGFTREKVINFFSFFQDREPDTIPSEIYKKLELTNHTIVMLAVGFLTYRKGQLFLLKALSEIRLKNPLTYSRLKLLIIGNGENKELLEDYINMNKLQDKVILLGYRSDHISFLKVCDIFIIPSIEKEDLPLVLLSAMQYKKCIIASKFAGIAELLTNRYDALLIEPDKETLSHELAESIICLANNKALRTELSTNVGTTFNKSLSLEKYSTELLNLYNN